MKSLQLTDTHRSLLTKMATILFSAEGFRFSWGSMTFHPTAQGNDVLIINVPSSDSWDRNTRLHWFEFVQTWLAEKIFNPDPKKVDRGLRKRMEKYFWDSNQYWYSKVCGGYGAPRNPEHPIDILYMEFQKMSSVDFVETSIQSKETNVKEVVEEPIIEVPKEPQTYVWQRLKSLIVTLLGVEPEEVLPSANIHTDLGADSLDHVEIIMKVESEFNRSIPDETAENLTNVGDLYQWILMNSQK
jgi:acyl carrier protein